jgi:hypothetical protein
MLRGAVISGAAESKKDSLCPVSEGFVDFAEPAAIKMEMAKR